MKYLYYSFLVAIIFISNINAESKEYVAEIIFNGNSAFTDYDLSSIIKMQTPKLFFRSAFSPKRLNRDKVSLEAYYKSYGFLEVEIIAEYITISTKYRNIIFEINEGDQFQLKNLHLYGNKILSDESILSILDVPFDQYYNPGKIRKKLKSLKKEYMSKGKLDISIMDEITIVDRFVTARINISEGSTYYIQNIYISGLESVKDKYVLREILFKTKEVYDVDIIGKSKRNIFDSGLFSSVEINHKKIAGLDGLIDIEIKVREYQSSSIEVNIGFKELTTHQENLTTTGIDSHARLIFGSIFNTSSRIEISGRIASEITSDIFSVKPFVEKDLTLIYRTPWTFYFRLPSRIKYFHTEESDEQYDFIANGLTYSLYFEKNRGTRYEINSTVESIQSDDNLYPDHNREPSREINIKYLSNHIHNPLNPEGGQYLLLSASLFGTVLGGERNLYKIYGEYRRYLQVLNNSIFAIRLITGYIYNLEDTYDLPYLYKFHLGGQTSLRGWRSHKEFENPEGSLIKELFNLEYRFPLKNKFGGELFFDCGRLYDTINEITSTSISWDYGTGLIYQTGLGPIRVDIGFPYGNISNPQLHASLLYLF